MDNQSQGTTPFSIDVFCPFLTDGLIIRCILQELGKVVECVCEGYKYLHLFTEWWDNG